MSQPRRYLFRFGYESPEDRRVNEGHDSDFESSAAIWIEALDEQGALNWGQQIAETFVRHIFRDAAEATYSWIETGYANWIESEPSEGLGAVPNVVVGEMPDFETLLPSASPLA